MSKKILSPVKRIIGYIPELADLYDVLTPMEFLMLIGRLHDLEDQQIEERATRMLDFLGLKDQLHHRMDTFSKGMRQKVLLVSGMLHNPGDHFYGRTTQRPGCQCRYFGQRNHFAPR